MTNFLEHLIEDPGCLYIYNRDFSIYGLPSKERYTIVVKDDFLFPEEFSDEYFDNSEKYQILYLQEWFDCVLNGKLIGWECACLNKKYIIKEHVKLLMTTNPIQLRKDIDSMYKVAHLSSAKSNEIFYNLIRAIRFSIQIIQNHKIVNYKDGLEDVGAIESAESIDEIWQIIDKSYTELKSLTDGMIKQQILKKANKCKNTE